MEDSGEFEVDSKLDTVWGLISDANKFSKFLPDVTSVEVDGDHFDIRFNVDIRKYTSKFMGASYLSNISVKFSGSLSEKKQNEHVKIDGKGSAVGMKFSVSLGIDLVQSGDKVDVKWVSSIETGGLAKIFGDDIMTEAVKSTVGQIIENMKKGL